MTRHFSLFKPVRDKKTPHHSIKQEKYGDRRHARFLKIKHAADFLASLGVPYQYGGGHQGNRVPDKPSGIDCSATVCYVLQHAGYHLNTMDSGHLASSWGVLGRGKYVTIWANQNHAFMQIGSRFFGTSRSHRNGGPGWIDNNSYPTDGFTPKHPKFL